VFLSCKCKFDNAATCTNTRARDEGITAQGEEQQDKGHAGEIIVSLVSLILEERRIGWEEENYGRIKRKQRQEEGKKCIGLLTQR
jgi:hypothetical protein